MTVVAALMLALLETPEPAEHSEPRVAPVVGVGAELGFQRMVVVIDGKRHSELRPLGVPAKLELGAQVWYRRGDRFGDNGWRGVFMLGAGPLLPTGGWPLSLQHMSLRELGRAPRVRFGTGVAAQISVDLPRARLPFAAVGVPLCLVTRHVDLCETPSLSVPLHLQQFEVFGGRGSRGVAPMIMPVVVSLRIKAFPDGRRRKG